MSDAFTIWFTGMARSGKSEIGAAVAEVLRSRRLTVELLDSGRIRREINRTMGFSRQEVVSNLLRLGYECRLLNKNGVIAIAVAVSPFRDVRDTIREQIERFVEVYCRCPLEELKRRDETGLFARAEEGDIAHVAGVNAPYEEPEKPEVLLDTDKLSVKECADQVVTTLEVLGRIDRVEASAYTPEQEEMIRKRLQDLGYI